MRKITDHSVKTCTGDAGVVRLPGPLSVLLLLPAGRLRFLCAAHWDHRPGATGIQPAGRGVGPGDGGPSRPSRLGENPSVQLRLAGLRNVGARRPKLTTFPHALRIFSSRTAVASKSQAARYLMSCSVWTPLLSQFCHWVKCTWERGGGGGGSGLGFAKGKKLSVISARVTRWYVEGVWNALERRWIQVLWVLQCWITVKAGDGTHKILSHFSHLMRLCIKHGGLSVFVEISIVSNITSLV